MSRPRVLDRPRDYVRGVVAWQALARVILPGSLAGATIYEWSQLRIDPARADADGFSEHERWRLGAGTPMS